MGILRMVRSSTADDVASLKTRVEVERAAGLAALSEAERLEAAGLAAETYQDAKALGEQAAELRWQADRAAQRLEELQQRLAEAQVAHDRADLDRHRKAVVALYHKLKKTILEAARLQAEIITAREMACAALGEHVVSLHIPHVVYRGLVLPDLVDLWVRETDRTVAPPPPRPVAPITTAATLAADRRNIAPGLGRATMLHEPAATPPSRPPNPDDLAPLGPDEARCRVLRPGYELPSGQQADRGQVIRLPSRIAELAANNGALEIIELAGEPK